MKKTLCLLVFVLVFLSTAPVWAQGVWTQQVKKLVQNGAVLAVDQQGQVLFSYQADRPFVPASALKVPTALAALKILGPEYRFRTEFFTDDSGTLYIKGYGDPLLFQKLL